MNNSQIKKIHHQFKYWRNHRYYAWCYNFRLIHIDQLNILDQIISLWRNRRIEIFLFDKTIRWINQIFFVDQSFSFTVETWTRDAFEDCWVANLVWSSNWVRTIFFNSIRLDEQSSKFSSRIRTLELVQNSNSKKTEYSS